MESRRCPTRRDALRILAIGGAAGLAWKLGLFDRRRGQPVRRGRTMMGTEVKLTVVGDDAEAAEAAAEATLERMAEWEALLSRHRPDSEVSILNATGRVEDASDVLLDVLRLADRISRLGDGAFDVTVEPLVELYRRRQAQRALPGATEIEQVLARVNYRALRIEGRRVRFDAPGMGVTLDGIGKGHVVDGGVATLRRHGFDRVYVEAGGDLVASGEKERETPWRIGIRNPRPGPALQARFDVRDRAVATSGDYMQSFAADYSQHHILDPRTGFSAPELASCTVIADNAATADALATLTMVLGPDRGRDVLEGLPGCEGYLIAKDLQVVRTSGFALV